MGVGYGTVRQEAQTEQDEEAQAQEEKKEDQAQEKKVMD